MADIDKNILITPNTSVATEFPTIDFTGFDANTLTLSVLNDGTLSISGSSGQLFAISDDLTGTIFSVNDISGIPSIEVFASGIVSLAEFSGNVGIGNVAPAEKLDLVGNAKVTGAVTATGGVDSLTSATTTVNVAAATAPTLGQVLTATSGTAATWQTPAEGGSLTGITDNATGPVLTLGDSSIATTVDLVVGTQTPSVWSTAYDTVQVSNMLALVSDSSVSRAYINHNSYNNGQWRYKTSNGASHQVFTDLGSWVVYTAPAGTAGNPITWTPNIAANVSGNTELYGALRLKERADHLDAPTATWGEVWVKNSAPNMLMFTDDAGTDFELNVAGVTRAELADSAETIVINGGTF